jgi:FkbM family methyltransferase
MPSTTAALASGGAASSPLCGRCTAAPLFDRVIPAYGLGMVAHGPDGRPPMFRRWTPWRIAAAYHTKAAAKWMLNYRGSRESIFRQYVFDLCARVSPSIAVEANGIRYYLSTADKEVSRKTFMRGEFEQEKLRIAVDLVESATGRSLVGKEWIEIGANIGTTTVPAIKVFGAAHVWAFEPAPGNLGLLRCNIGANGIEDQVTIIPVALSNRRGVADFELSPDSWGDHRVASNERVGSMGEERREHICVVMERFDDVVPGLDLDMSRVGLVWIDTQGHEGRVLDGASQIVRSDVPVLSEYWPYGLRRSFSLELFHDLVRANYTTVIDIGSKEGPIEYAAENVAELEAKYHGISFTDVLLL